MRKILCFVIIATVLCLGAAHAEEDYKIYYFTDASIADVINNSELTKNATAQVSDEILKISLTKGAQDPHFMLPVEGINAVGGEDNILAICVKTTFRTFEYDYAYATFVTDEGEGVVTANSYAVTERWQVIFFRLGSNENYKGNLKSIRIDPFENAPDKDEDLLYQIKWFGFFKDINSANEFANDYLNEINPTMAPGETEVPHKTSPPPEPYGEDNSIWGFVWTIVAMLAATVVITYFLEKMRKQETEKSKTKKKKR
ncbi:MAG TPA: hypothetical protein PLI11_09325 [Clostridia bacterium]|nr:hypothetical protein [Clostridia bacterium]